VKVVARLIKWDKLKKQLEPMEKDVMLRIGMYVEDGGEYDKQCLAKVKRTHALRVPLMMREQSAFVSENSEITRAIVGHLSGFSVLKQEIKEKQE
jgi:hypothetical protein